MNPFQAVYDALWDLVLTSTELATLVKEGNRIRFDKTARNPLKHALQVGDVPELILLPLGSQSANLSASSCTTHFHRQYQFILATGDLRLAEGLDTVSWNLLCAFANWRAVLGPLTWNEKRFVQGFDITAITDGLRDSENNKNLNGWSSLLTVSVFMQFRTQDLIGDL